MEKLKIFNKSFFTSINYFVTVTVIMLVFSALLSFSIGYYGGDLESVGYGVKVDELIFFNIAIVFSLSIIYFSSKFISNIEFKIKYRFINHDWFIYLFFFNVTLLSLVSVFYGNVGSIQRDVSTNRVGELFFAFFNPYTMLVFFIYYSFFKKESSFFKNLIFYFVFFSYIVLILRSGFSGFLFYILPILICYAILFFGYGFTIFLLFISVFSFPFIRIFKWYAGSGFTSNINFTDVELILLASKGVIDRFSFVPNMIYISNSNIDDAFIIQSHFNPVFQGYLGNLFHKVFFNENVQSITLYLHQNMQNTLTDSNSTFPLLSYFSINVYYGGIVLFFSFFYFLLYAFFLKLVFSFINVKHNGVCFFLLFSFTYMYLLQGWFWEAASTLQAIFIFLAILYFNMTVFNSKHTN